MKFSPTTTIFGFATLLAVSLVSGTLARWRSDAPLPWRQAWSQRLSTLAEQDGFAVVDRAQVEALLAAGTHLVFDARPLAEFDQGHLPGAMSLPEGEFDEHFAMIAPMLVPDGPILVYCSSPACDSAFRLAQRLRDAGYALVSYYAAGYEDWMAREGAP